MSLPTIQQALEKSLASVTCEKDCGLPPCCDKTTTRKKNGWRNSLGSRAKQQHIFLHFAVCLSIAVNVSFYYQLSHPKMQQPLRAAFLDEFQEVGFYNQLSVVFRGDHRENRYRRVSLTYPDFSDTEPVPTRPDYGGLKFQFLQPGQLSRVIVDDVNDSYPSTIEHKRLELNAYDDHMASILRRDDNINPEAECKPPTWSFNQFPNCNNFHDVDILENIIGHEDDPTGQLSAASYLGAGFYRLSWKLRRRDPLHPDSFDFVMKMLKPDKEFIPKILRTVQIEAYTMERLTASPRMMNIYGHCAGSIYVEPGKDMNPEIFNANRYISHEDMTRLQEQRKTVALNNMTSTEKLDLAIIMAESIAELHGFEGGVIALVDVYFDQWLRSSVDGQVKLNDFNNGAFLEWSEKQQDYCPLFCSFSGRTHSPEEHYDPNIGWMKPLVTERSDIIDFANVLYNILTGLEVYFTEWDHDKARAKMLAAQIPYIDPRFRETFIERRLVEAMERMWKLERYERPTIFEVLRFLRETKDMASQQLQSVQ